MATKHWSWFIDTGEQQRCIEFTVNEVLGFAEYFCVVDGRKVFEQSRSWNQLRVFDFHVDAIELRVGFGGMRDVPSLMIHSEDYDGSDTSPMYRGPDVQPGNSDYIDISYNTWKASR